MYPESWFDYSIKCGLNDLGEETTFVIVDIYPLRYQPLKEKINTFSILGLFVFTVLVSLATSFFAFAVLSFDLEDFFDDFFGLTAFSKSEIAR